MVALLLMEAVFALITSFVPIILVSVTPVMFDIMLFSRR